MGRRKKASRGRSSLMRAAGAARSALNLGSFIPDMRSRISRPSKSALRGLPLHWRIAILTPVVVVSLGGIVLAALLISYTVTIPNPLTLRSATSGPVIRVLARDGTLLAERGAAQDYIPIDMLPDRVINAVVATEDRRFWTHWGIDPMGLARAAFSNLRAGRFAEGGSTLTQQLAKNLFLTPERTLARKLEELVLAVWLELRLSKRDILELYLNRVYFGAGAYGIEAAAQRYFDKSARQLSLAEAAVIAGLLKAPSRYAPSANPRLAIARGHAVLTKMREAGLIRPEEELRARASRIAFVDGKRSIGQSKADYAIDLVLERLPKILDDGHGEIVVDTTLDSSLQSAATSIVADELGRADRDLAASQAGLIILDTDGGIRAVVGGRSYAESQFNRAVKARRQPGSAFKPIVYLAALEAGFQPNSVAYDLPFNLDGWSPKNDNGRHVGPVTLRHALAQSINTVAARLLMEAGPDRVVSLARRLGITSELRSDPSLALGTSEVTLLELTGTYGTFATGGRRVEPHIVRRIRSRQGRVLYARSAPHADQLASPAAVGDLNGMLTAAVTHGTGQRAQVPGHSVAGKTGTTQDFRDAWFVGYTAHLIGGVWVGNDDGKPMNRVSGGSLPARIWQRVMVKAHEGREALALPGIGERLPWLAVQPHLAETERPAPARELLPWDMPETLKERSPATSRGPAKPQAIKSPAARPAYPRDRIDEEFIARALAATPSEALSGPLASNLGPSSTPPPALKLPSFAKPHAPSGMMSLGAALR